MGTDDAVHTAPLERTGAWIDHAVAVMDVLIADCADHGGPLGPGVDAENEVTGNAEPKVKTCTIVGAISGWHIGRTALREAVKKGKLTDHRTKPHASNKPLLFDAAELTRHYKQRDTPRPV